jgi:hypothetical protein
VKVEKGLMRQESENFKYQPLIQGLFLYQFQ